MDYSSLPPVLSVRELDSFLNIGINGAYRLVRTKKIFSVRVGRQYRIPIKAIEDFLEIC